MVEGLERLASVSPHEAVKLGQDLVTSGAASMTFEDETFEVSYIYSYTHTYIHTYVHIQILSRCHITSY